MNEGKVIQVAGPAVDVEFPEGHIPVIRTAIRITSEGFNVPDGASVCWRHDRNPNNPKPGDWTDWTRATLFPGQSTSTDL